MEQRDFWDQLDAFQRGLEEECAEKVADGKLGEFEIEWQDPMPILSTRDWFGDATSVPKRVAANSLRIEIHILIEYYRFAEKVLAAA